MKLVFEGTEEQIKNLKLLVEQGDNDLPKVREDYQTENLWSVNDVQAGYECTDEEALEILESALTDDGVMERIWFAIDYHADFILNNLNN
jgi:hypothetical protein